MTGYDNVLTLTLPAAVTNGIAQSQTPGGAGNLTLNGSLVSGGVANLVIAQRVGIHSAADDSGHTFTITGTDRYSRPLVESIIGATAGNTVNTNNDFLSVTNVAINAAASGAVFAGTNGIGSTAPLIVDRFVNPANYNAALTFTGTANASVEVSLDDLAPAWDMTVNSPNWFAPASFAAKNTNTLAQLVGPYTMARLTVNSGTGAVKLTIVTPYIAGV